MPGLGSGGLGSSGSPVAPTVYFEQLVRQNNLNQMATPTTALTMGGNQIINGAASVTASGFPTTGQLAGNQYAYVVSGCVWTSDGGTLTASMTAGTVMIKGILLTVSAVTSHTFLANCDTYVDVIDGGVGFGNLQFTPVPNNSLSPVFGGGSQATPTQNMLDTVRLAIVSAGASSIGSTVSSICQGSLNTASGATYLGAGTLGATTVAAGSNGQSIGALTNSTLQIAANTNWSTGGGWFTVAHSGGQTYTCQYTGVYGNNLTGITVLGGSGTVSTGDTVQQIFSIGQTTTGSGPVGLTDFLGNLIYPTSPYPRVIGAAVLPNQFTTTVTGAVPVPGFYAPFIIPVGFPAQRIRIRISSPTVTATSTAGSTITVIPGLGNPVSSPVGFQPEVIVFLAVSGDGVQLTVDAPIGPTQAPGSYIGSTSINSNAAGTLKLGQAYAFSILTVEYV